LHDERTAYRVALDRGEFLVLAECDADKFVLHPLEPVGERLYFMDGRDGTPEVHEGDIETLFRQDRRAS